MLAHVSPKYRLETANSIAETEYSNESKTFESSETRVVPRCDDPQVYDAITSRCFNLSAGS